MEGGGDGCFTEDRKLEGSFPLNKSVKPNKSLWWTLSFFMS